MGDITRSIPLLLMLVFFILSLKMFESYEHAACLKSGGDVVLGWFQDGCTTRKAQP